VLLLTAAHDERAIPEALASGTSGYEENSSSRCTSPQRSQDRCGMPRQLRNVFGTLSGLAA
jgi:hypothetical protein